MTKSSTAFYVDFAVTTQQEQPVNLLTERKPGTPTKRKEVNSNEGEENETILGNQLHASPQLPVRLQKRLESLPGRPTAEKILQKAEQVEMKREEMIRAKVEGAKEETSKVEAVRARKKAFEKNISLLGDCQPSTLREITPVRLPKKLQKRVRELELGYKTRREANDKEAVAAVRRDALLAEKVRKQQEHTAKVNSLLQAKTTIARFEVVPSFLPKRLQKRLESFRRPTNQAILRKEALVATRKKLKLEGRVQATREHHIQVELVCSTKKAFEENQVDFITNESPAKVIRLPKKLKERLQSLKPKWTQASIYAKEDAAQNKNEVSLQERTIRAAVHSAKVGQLCRLKITEPRFDVEAIPDFLPDNLKARLSKLRRGTKEAILRKEKLVELRGKIAIAAISKKAHDHNQVVVPRALELKRSLASNNIYIHTGQELEMPPFKELPKNLQNRLAALHSSSRKWTPEKQYTKESGAEERRTNLLEGVMASSQERWAKVEKVCAGKQFEARFGNNKIPQTLPENLRLRLEGIKRRGMAAILRKNDIAFTRARIHTEARAARARLENAAIAEATELGKNMKATGINFVTRPGTATPLPKRLVQRAKKYRPKWTPTSILEQEATVAERKAAKLQERERSLKMHNMKVQRRMLAKIRVARFEGESSGADFLPKPLKERLEQFTKPTPEAILRKNAQAAVRRDIHLKAVSSSARASYATRMSSAQALRDELEENGIDIKCESPAIPRLPEKLSEKVRQRKIVDAESIIAKEEAAAKRRANLLKNRKSSARKHSTLVKKRMIAKETQERFDVEALPDFLPETLKKRLSTVRRPTDDSIIKFNERMAMRASLMTELKRQNATAHLEHVKLVQKVRDSYRENMEILTKNQTTPVKLPRRFQNRLKEIEKASPAPDSLIEKGKSASKKRAALLAARSEKLADHSRKVREVWQKQKLKPKFSEEEISSKEIPSRLKNRLKTLRSPTKEVLDNKQHRAKQRRNSLLEAKVDSATKHSEYVAQVKSLKEEFNKNMQFLHDERDESPGVQIPEELQKKLRVSKLPHKTPEEILQKESAVQNQREAILSEKVASAKKHYEKVKSVQERKKQLQQQEQVPETN